MTKEKRTRKELVKNIAIVFLVLMLILTFFSNTIMNYSLPEINGKYAEYGSIRTGVRGSGVASANSVFEQAVKGDTRVVEVFVREGDSVVEGQVLMTLESSAEYNNSTEIKTLEEQLKGLEEAYERALLSKTEPDYTLEEMEIEEAREALEALRERRAGYTPENIDAINEEYEKTEKALSALDEKIEELEQTLSEISDESDNEEIAKARRELERVAGVLDFAEVSLENAKEKLSEYSYTDLSSLNSQHDSYSRSLTKLYDELAEKKEEHADILSLEDVRDRAKSVYETSLDEYESAWGDFDPETEPTDGSQMSAWTSLKGHLDAYTKAEKECSDNADAIKSAKAEIKDLETQIEDMNYDMSLLSKEISKIKTENKNYTKYETAVELAESEYETCKAAYEKAEKALLDAVSKVSKTLTDEIKSAKAERKTLEKSLAAALEKKEEADGVATLDAEIKSSERSLERMEYNLRKQKEADERAESLDEFDLKKQREEMDSIRAEIRELRALPEEGEFEFKAKYTGRITSFSCRVGDTLYDGSVVAAIESENSGYTLSFSVANSDAAKVKVGDTATVSGGYWGSNISATLTSVKTEQGGKTKLLTFELSGDVVSGQALTLIAGEKNTPYNSVIPKSAVREDSKGKFVYITKTKSTPLGNRYVATRVPVEILASDDVNCAVSSVDYPNFYEFVITSTTKPISDGDYVRLAD